MSLLSSFIPSQQENYFQQKWAKGECYKFYVQQRCNTCSYDEIIDIWLLAPYCDQCVQSDPFYSFELPEITPDNWKIDVLIHLGNNTLSKIQQNRIDNPEFGVVCKKCCSKLRPWNGDSIYIDEQHLEEHYGIDIETPGRKNPPKRRKKLIEKLYQGSCFGCGRSDLGLHIDHIIPQSKGGDAAFRNLQPLCKKCGNEKGDDMPSEVRVYSDLYFDSYPSDSYEGLFW